METRVAYLCDRKACEVCSNPDGDYKGCNHTLDVFHAVNFKTINKTLVIEEPKVKVFTSLSDVAKYITGKCEGTD